MQNSDDRGPDARSGPTHSDYLTRDDSQHSGDLTHDDSHAGPDASHPPSDPLLHHSLHPVHAPSLTPAHAAHAEPHRCPEDQDQPQPQPQPLLRAHSVAACRAHQDLEGQLASREEPARHAQHAPRTQPRAWLDAQQGSRLLSGYVEGSEGQGHRQAASLAHQEAQAEGQRGDRRPDYTCITRPDPTHGAMDPPTPREQDRKARDDHAEEPEAATTPTDSRAP